MLKKTHREKLIIRELGLVEYDRALVIQDEIQSEIIASSQEDILLLLNHPPVMTMGQREDSHDILVPMTELKNRGIAVFQTDRGGQITYHGPGQLVGYPIIDLNRLSVDLQQYIRGLEECIIRTLLSFDIQGKRDPEHPGVWVGNEKIGSLGVKVRKWVTKHGFSLNINCDLDPFSLINPCGITDRGVTSMTRLLNREVTEDEVLDILINNFALVFGYDIKSIIRERLI